MNVVLVLPRVRQSAGVREFAAPEAICITETLSKV